MHFLAVSKAAHFCELATHANDSDEKPSDSGSKSAPYATRRSPVVDFHIG
jgi:hypothetical protein